MTWPRKSSIPSILDSLIVRLTRFIEHTGGRTPDTAKEVAEMLILKRIDLEGYISAINDDFFIAFIVTLLCVVPVLFLRTKKG